MLEHIVKNQESLDDILNMYHLQVEELRDANLHITDLHHLVCGMKIKIPILTEEVEQILESTESFVKRYYPKLEETFEEEKRSHVLTQPIEVEKESAPEEKKTVEPHLNRRAYPGILPPKNPYKRP